MPPSWKCAARFSGRLGMVIKGNARGGGAELARHLQRTDTNERMSVLEVRGVAALDIDGALREMEIVSAGARTAKPFYHASINTPIVERMTEAQRVRAIDRLEDELGLTGQPRVVVLHVKEGREHTHVAWSRIDAETLTAIPDSHNYRRHEIVARELEREFGHERVQGVHVERDGVPRPERTPSLAETRQAERSGFTPDEIRERVTALWQATDSGKAFAAALDDAGFVLAKGDKRDFVLIDEAGETHSLGRRVDGVKAAAVRERMADIDPATLPSVDAAKAIQHDRHHDRHQAADAARQAEPAKEQPREPLPPEIENIQKTVRHADDVWHKFEERQPAQSREDAQPAPEPPREQQAREQPAGKEQEQPAAEPDRAGEGVPAPETQPERKPTLAEHLAALRQREREIALDRERQRGEDRDRGRDRDR